MTFEKTSRPTDPEIPAAAKHFDGKWYQCGHNLARVFKCAVGWGAVVYDAIEVKGHYGPGHVAGVGHFVLGEHKTEAKAVEAAGAFLELLGTPRMNIPSDIDSARAARRSEANGKPRAIRAKSQVKRKDVATGDLFSAETPGARVAQ